MEIPAEQNENASRLSPVDDNLLAEEAEEAFSTGGESTGEKNLLAVEFYYGKVKKDGRTIKTGKIYWCFTVWSKGTRKRVSPTSIYGKQPGITSIESCPFKGRVLDFYRRSLGAEKYTGDSTGGTSVDSGLSGSESTTA